MKTQELLGYFLPSDTLEYFEIEKFEIKEGKEKYLGKYGFDDQYTIVLKEKNILPDIPALDTNKPLRTKGYSEKIIEDYPIRGRKTRLKFRIRKWQIDREKGIYQRKLEISTKGVKYTKEYAFFFEEGN